MPGSDKWLDRANELTQLLLALAGFTMSLNKLETHSLTQKTITILGIAWVWGDPKKTEEKNWNLYQHNDYQNNGYSINVLASKSKFTPVEWYHRIEPDYPIVKTTRHRNSTPANRPARYCHSVWELIPEQQRRLQNAAGTRGPESLRFNRWTRFPNLTINLLIPIVRRSTYTI